MSDKQVKAADPTDLLGPPPLLRGEDEALYFAVQAEVESMIEPKNILDRATVRDITDAIWEAQRCKRFQARLIESARVSALANILLPIFGLKVEAAFEAANMYYGHDPQKHQLAVELLAKHQITEEMIHAKALAQHCGQIAYFDRMIVSREIARNRLFRDHKQRNDTANSARGSVRLQANTPRLPKRPGWTVIS